MRMSTKRRLAVDAMIDLALHEQSWPVPLAGIARRQGVSLSHLERLFAQLRTAGLVHSTRGIGGGYALGQDAGTISVAAIVGAVEVGAICADRDLIDLADELSKLLDAEMQRHMAVVSLADLVVGQRDAGVIVDVRPRPGVVALRRGQRIMAPRPRASPDIAGIPNSVFELGTLMANEAVRPGGQ